VIYIPPGSIILERIQRAFLSDELRELARATNLVQRERKFDFVALFCTLSFGFAAGSDRSIQAFLERFVEVADCDGIVSSTPPSPTGSHRHSLRSMIWTARRIAGDILRAVTEAASLDRGNSACCRSVSGLTLPRSAGRVSPLAREHPVASSRGLPSASESSPRGFSTWLSPKRSCLAAPVSAPVIPFDRARRAPQTWVECGQTPAVASHRKSLEPVCKPLE
jgi:hypothetical protein